MGCALLPFPAAIEQMYFETLQQLRFNFGRITNYAQAQRLITRLESRCLPRLTRLKATYGLINDSQDQKSPNDDNRCLGGTIPGQMDSIAEEVEHEEDEDIQLDEDDYAVDEDDFDEDDEEDDDGRNEGRLRSSHLRTSEPESNNPCVSIKNIMSNREVQSEELNCSIANKNNDINNSLIVNGEYDIEGDDDVQVEEEEDMAVTLGLKPRFVDCHEDREFCEALDRMTADALLSTPGMTGNINLTIADPTLGVARPGTLPTPDILQLAVAKCRQLNSTNSDTDHISKSPSDTQRFYSYQSKYDEDSCKSTSDQDNNTTTTKTIPFTFITRRGNRHNLVPLSVPETVQFASRYVEVKAAEQKEKARMKQLVLEMHEAQKEEEIEWWGHVGNQDAMLAHQFPVNVNRDRWVKYNHPKGAPDADTVFGTSR